MYSSYNSLLDHTGLSSSPGSEPMALGSPPLGSPPRGQMSATGHYLPGYLLGDSLPVTGSPSSRLWPLQSAMSPTKGHHNTSTSLNLSPTRQALSPIPQQHPSSNTSFARGYPQRSVSEKHGGPPVSGLFDGGSMCSPSLSLTMGASTPLGQTSMLRTAQFHKSISGIQLESQITPVKSFVPPTKSPPSPNQLDPFYSQGQSLTADDILDETWVTVFGFPPSASSYLIQQFSQYGNIIEHKISSCGNWMHIHYQSKLQAKKALSKNGKVFSGSIMIGVTPCIDKNVMSGSLKENVSYVSSDSLPGDTSMSGTANRSVNFPSSMRALSQSYRAAANEHEVVPTGSMPQKTNTLVSKAMEYVFGW